MIPHLMKRGCYVSQLEIGRGPQRWIIREEEAFVCRKRRKRGVVRSHDERCQLSNKRKNLVQCSPICISLSSAES